jgi:hypothetical protein
MGFASTYLEDRALFPEIIKEAPDDNTGIIVVVPAYDEPSIADMLDSLASCREVPCKTEVIVIVNAPENATPESIENNKLTLRNIESWKKEHTDCFFRLFSFNAEPIPVRGWGVGLARKTGMDEAVRRFNMLDRPDGVILNLDADCRVAPNYFTVIYDEFLNNKERAACSIYFEHPLSGSHFPGKIFTYIALYELHLRYYYQGLALSGFPYVFHTVGSAIAVKAWPYIKAGGMNRRQAGEDFYFIQKLLPAGGYFSLNTTTVYPSPRSSFRVPFGTGASIGKLNESDRPALLTYNILAFRELRSFFAMAGEFYNCNEGNLADLYLSLPSGLKAFTDEKEFAEKINEIRQNTSTFPSFKKRFFGWFNMFRIVKYLNFVHADIYEKTSIEMAASELLKEIGVSYGSDSPAELLNIYRSLERGS